MIHLRSPTCIFMAQTANFRTNINDKKSLWDTEASKSVISRGCWEKLHITQILWPCTGIHLSSMSDGKIVWLRQATLNLQLGKSELTHIHSMLKFMWTLILGLDFHHKFRIRAGWNKNVKLFLHKNGQIITDAVRPLTELLIYNPVKTKKSHLTQQPLYKQKCKNLQ